MTVTYRFPAFSLVYDPASGYVTTHFPDGLTSPVATNADHYYHATHVGADLTPALYNLAHELAHHLVGIHYFAQDYSPVIRRSAEGKEQEDPERELEEWMATALTYYAFGAELRDQAEYGALLDLATKCRPRRLGNKLRWCEEAASGKFDSPTEVVM